MLGASATSITSILAVLVLVLATGLACAAKRGWTVDDRSCAVFPAPRVCLTADPDAPVGLSVGGTRIIPGECARAPTPRGGGIRVVLTDGRNGTERVRRLRVPRRGTATLDVSLRPAKPPRVRVTRRGCE